MVDGTDKPGIFVFRTLEDCEDIEKYARGKGRAAVIGGGLLGLEAARGLQTHNVDVVVIHRSGGLMGQQLDLTASSILKRSMEKTGIQVMLNKNTATILGTDHVTGLRFTDGSTLDCDMVVFAAGIRANAEIAALSGLKVDKGIVVDNHMRCVNDQNIYAVGECAQHSGKVYGLVAPLWEQAKYLADHITGSQHSTYSGSKVATKLKVMEVEMASMGITEPEFETDEIVQFTEPSKGTYKKLIIREGKLAGAILLGDTSKATYLMQVFDRNTMLPEDRLSLLFDIGATKPLSVGDMADEMQVCNCNGVTKGAVVMCVKSGRKTAKAVMEKTRAGMGCGSCKSVVSEVIDWACGGAAEEDPSIHYYVPGVPMKKPELIKACKEKGLKSVSAVFRELNGGKEDPASKPGLASLLNTIWPGEYEDQRDARYINDRVHANIQKDATFSVIPQMAGGVTNPDQLRRIADVADKYDVPLVKLTGGQRIDLLGIKKDDLPKIWQDLDMPSGFAYGKYYRTCKSCVGTDYCRFGVGDSTSLAIQIENRFQGLDTPGKLKLATAGCPRNCSEAMVKDLGAVAVEGGKWEIYVGGAAGAHVRKGDLLCSVDSHAEVLVTMGRFIQYYRENGKYLERTYGFVERIGIDKLRAIVVQDSEGIVSRLDRAMDESVAAYRDPWKEAFVPATVNQFAAELAMMA